MISVRPRLLIAAGRQPSRVLADELHALQRLANDRRSASLRQAIRRLAQKADPRPGRERAA